VKILISLFLCVGVAFGSELPISEQKTELLKLKRQKIKADTDVGKKSWISPLIISASLTKSSDVNERQSETKNAGIDWSQDIFRSGGIYYSIDKAEALGQVNMFDVDIQEAHYLKQIYTFQAKIQRDMLKNKQSELTLKNRDIDLLIIEQKYKVSRADITELNRATIDRDRARTDLIDVKNTLRNEVYELKKLIWYEKVQTVVLPDIPFISKPEYLKQHLELLKYMAQDKNDDALWKITRSSYLPKLTLNASFGYSDISGDVIDGNTDNYRYGAVISMPFDINTKSAVESERLGLMQTRVAQQDRKLELEQEYEMRLATIADYEEKIGVAEEMLKMYNELYEFTKSQVNAGFKSAYELESLGNSVEIQELEKEMQSYNILIEKISLYFDMKR
jgi:outer membrane protein TolC